MVYQKLESIQSDLQNVDNLKQMWKDVSAEDQQKNLQNINFEFDVKNGQIHATSKAVDESGNALYDWNLHQETGQITEQVT
jgi:hypothetical protein